MSSSNVGELLVRTNLISREALDAALGSPEFGEKFIGTILVEQGAVEQEKFLETLSRQYGIKVFNSEDFILQPELFDLIPENLALKHGFIPVEQDEGSATIAMYDPSNLSGINEVKFACGTNLRVVLASEQFVKAEHEKMMAAGDVNMQDIMDQINNEDFEVVAEEDVNLAEMERASEDAPVVKLVNAILQDAIGRGTSDIHVEPYEKDFRVRFRIDGVLQEIMNPPLKLKNALTSRLKIMANLDISERRLPQDGRIKLKLGSRGEMDFRVNVLPTLFGEKVVLRLLDKSNLQLDMTKLGFFEHQLKDFLEAIHVPQGMVLVTGPTGSGKTTTLYSALSELNNIETNINTAEDPVEFNLNGINQAQMHDDIGFNFSSALRAFLRQDPDIIMVGEIRDYETAEIAIKASLTGHLVLSTLHTNGAPATISRLLNMGVEPFLVASSLTLVVAQRLGRKICSNCITDDPDKNVEAYVQAGMSREDAESFPLKKGAGCNICGDTGYKGRVAFYEVLKMSDELKEFILNGASTTELAAEAERLGMWSLRASALNHVKIGNTTLDEVVRVTTE